MKKTLALFALITLFNTAAPIHAESSPVSTTFTTAYESRYVLYGYRLSRHLYMADIYLFKPLDENTSIWGGVWYGYLTDGTYQEVDVYGGIDRMITDTLTLGLAYSLFNYIEVPFPTSDHVSEFAAHATYASGGLSLQLREQYDTEADGHLVRAIGSYTLPLADSVSLVLGAEAGYAFNYFIDGNLWNHAEVSAKTPWQLNDQWSISPFIARSIPLAAIDDFEEYETYGGISASYTF
ncbi:MAG TPA: hypothetical protein PKC67_12545 [Kiritimatiellia bacterium]|nr:hypothetical protein [Kiritimatiellia bacterium]HMP35166.1 hypothetical protein [Kiritimatiellia bacterium]